MREGKRGKRGGEKRKKEKGGGKSYENDAALHGLLNVQNPLKIARVDVKKGGNPGGNRENKVAFLDPAKAPPKSQILPVQSLSRRRRACTHMLADRVPNVGTAVTVWSAHGDVP